MTRYVALLRGINVGGNNLIRMPALKACFEAQGFSDVATYIASGNVVFASPAKGAALAARIEAQLSKTFNYTATVVVRPERQMRLVVEKAPDGFGTRPDRYRYEVLFLKEPLKAIQAIQSVPTRDGVDQVWSGPGVLYYSRLIARATQSQLNRLVMLPIYKSITIRNWNTTTRLLALLQKDS